MLLFTLLKEFSFCNHCNRVKENITRNSVTQLFVCVLGSLLTKIHCLTKIYWLHMSKYKTYQLNMQKCFHVRTLIFSHTYGKKILKRFILINASTDIIVSWSIREKSNRNGASVASCRHGDCLPPLRSRVWILQSNIWSYVGRILNSLPKLVDPLEVLRVGKLRIRSCIYLRNRKLFPQSYRRTSVSLEER